MGKASKWLLRSVIVLLLVLLTLMSWYGGKIRFATLRAVTVHSSLAGFYHGILAVGSNLILHVIGSLLLLALGIVIAAFTFRQTRSIGFRVSAILGLVAVGFAIIEGVLFVVSSFQNFAYFQFMEWDTLVIYGLYFVALFYSLKKDRRNNAAL
jgi:hypothetical protein